MFQGVKCTKFIEFFLCNVLFLAHWHKDFRGLCQRKPLCHKGARHFWHWNTLYRHSHIACSSSGAVAYAHCLILRALSRINNPSTYPAYAVYANSREPTDRSREGLHHPRSTIRQLVPRRRWSCSDKSYNRACGRCNDLG